MTGLRRRLSVAFVLCLFVICAALPQEASPRVGTIYGTVIDATPDCSAEKCARLANCKSNEDAGHVLREIVGARPAAGAIVTARSHTVSREVIADAGGSFTFVDLPLGTYGVSAVMPAPPGEREGQPKVSVSKGVECGKTVRLVLHEELVTVSGRVFDSQGRPIAGAKVTGTAVPFLEVGIPPSRWAVSNAEGFYALQGFEPVNLYRAAGYLNGGSLDAVGALHTQVEIRVEAEGFQQDKASIPRVPLLTEAQLVPARRLWKALSELAVTLGNGEDWQQMKERPLPAGDGSTIIDVDVVLDR